jgi:hypothetical protein
VKNKNSGFIILLHNILTKQTKIKNYYIKNILIRKFLLYQKYQIFFKNTSKTTSNQKNKKS